MRGLIKASVVVVSLVLLLPAGTQAQTAATGTVSGSVTDPTGAVVPNAEVVLTDKATNLSRSQQTNADGQYVFVNVTPGVYRLTVTMEGFRQKTVSDLKVDVAKAYLVNVTLEVGAVAETVEVTAGVGAALQTTDATVGETIVGESLLRLPTANRSAAALLLLQPLVAPGRGVGATEGGQVAGARSDQSVFLVDGGDATSDVEGTMDYAAGTGGQPTPTIPVPQESIEEFRVGTTNPNATFGSAAGGQMAFVTKRGTNTLHGSGYWYHQNDNLQANTWTRNRLGQENPEMKDNRYGFTLGGPLVKDKLFLFGHFEGRRYPQSENITRVVPTDTLRQGILRFRDAAGNIVSYPLASSTLCGSTGTSQCDPRGLGISPVVQALWNLMPAGNDPTAGDGLNVIGFNAPADNSLVADFFVTRLDYSLSDKWNFFSSFRFYRHEQPDLSQIDIAGIKSGQPGQAVAVAAAPIQPRYLVWGLTGQMTPRMSNEVRFAYLRNWWEWRRTTPFPQVPGTAGALQLAGEDQGTAGNFANGTKFVAEPINIDTQNARGRTWSAKDTHLADNATWVKGRHTLQFGGSFRNWDIYHPRDDKVVGSLTALVYWLRPGALTILPENRPPACSATVTTNCLVAAERSRWDNLYAAVLGIVERASVLVAYDKNFNPLPFGTPLIVNMDVNQYELYVQDTWRVSPALTFTYGLHYQLAMPPVEEEGKGTLMIYRGTGELVRFYDYLNRRREAALQGQTYDPELAWATLPTAGRKHLFNPDTNNFGPRLSAAWNPSFTGGFLGKLFGDRKSVLRGGYSLMYDRLTSVNLVMGSPITPGIGQTWSCNGPRWTTGTCAGSSDASTGFRIGVDGSASPFPTIPQGTDPLTLSSPFGETISSQYDIDLDLGEHHSLNFTLQRELPGNLFFEAGYAGRLSRNLQARSDINSVPYFFTDPTSGQTLAEAFDAVAQELRAGVPASAVTPQPWFENLLSAGATRYIAERRGTDFVNGDLTRVTMYANGIIQWGGLPLVNLQVERNRVLVNGALSNYHGGFFVLRKRMSHGLTFNLNYTLSKTLDVYSLNQQNSNTNSSAFDWMVDYGPAFWDRRHNFNAHWFYELPLGRGRRLSLGNALDKIIGGWWTSGIFTASSGLPLCVASGGRPWGGGVYTSTTIAGCAVPISAPNFGNSPHYGVTGSGGVGTVGDVNLFADPQAVFANFRRVLISQDGRTGRGTLRGLARWNLDWSLGKKTAVTESVNIIFSFDFLNVFNHMEFADPSTSLTGPSSFGVLRAQFSTPRSVQFGFRVEF